MEPSRTQGMDEDEDWVTFDDAARALSEFHSQFGP